MSPTDVLPRRLYRRRAVLVTLLMTLAAAVLATGVIAGQFRSADPPSFHDALSSGDILRVAEVEARDGLGTRGVFAQLTETGQLCVWDAPSLDSLERGGGCNPTEEPLGGNAVSAMLAYEGGPAIATAREARIFGLAAADVAQLRVVMSDGSLRSIRAKKAKVGSEEFQAFGYRFRKSDLKKGIGPTAIVAYDASGAELGRQPTGIGG